MHAYTWKTKLELTKMECKLYPGRGDINNIAAATDWRLNEKISHRCFGIGEQGDFYSLT